MPLSFNARISIPKVVLVRELAGESVILNLSNECYYGLDEIGTRMLTVLSGSETIQAAYDTLLAEYDVDPEQLKQDLGNLVEKLVKNGLVNVSDPP